MNWTRPCGRPSLIAPSFPPHRTDHLSLWRWALTFRRWTSPSNCPIPSSWHWSESERTEACSSCCGCKSWGTARILAESRRSDQGSSTAPCNGNHRYRGLHHIASIEKKHRSWWQWVCSFQWENARQPGLKSRCRLAQIFCRFAVDFLPTDERACFLWW